MPRTWRRAVLLSNRALVGRRTAASTSTALGLVGPGQRSLPGPGTPNISVSYTSSRALMFSETHRRLLVIQDHFIEAGEALQMHSWMASACV